MARYRTHELLEDLDLIVPEAEPEEPGEDEALLEEIRDEARAFLTLPFDASLEQVQAAFGESLELYWSFFFGHYRVDEESGEETPGAPFHAELRARWQALVLGESSRKEDAVACPREHSKSVNGSLLLPLWALSNGHRRFAFLFSDTDTQAWGFLEDIRVEVETNERLQAIYPAFCVFQGKPRVNRLVFGNGAVMMAAGSGKSVRGARKGAQRPDLIIQDDIENDEEVENPKRRRKKLVWHNKVVKKLGKAAVILSVGTVLHADSFLANRIRSDADVFRAITAYPAAMNLWEEWEKIFHDRSLPDREAAARAFYEARQEEMDAGAVVLWPAKFSLYELMVERAEDLASFLSERQNDPFDPAASYFPEEALQFLEADDKPAVDQVRLSVGFWDPSRGTSKSDTSAAFRLDVLLDGRRFVSWGVAGQIPPEEVIETVVGAHKVRAFYAFGVEKVGLSNYDGDLQRVSRGAGVSLPVEPVTPQGEKQLRIKSMRPLVVSGGLLFAADLPLEAVRQIKYYGQHPNDDVWDAVQQANQLADVFLTDIVPAGGVIDPGPDAGRIERESMFGNTNLALPRFGERVGLIGRAWR
ncbi:MAG TPA: hypothetical protein VF615_25615 [Longimicrobiaceae bacterium]